VDEIVPSLLARLYVSPEEQQKQAASAAATAEGEEDEDTPVNLAMLGLREVVSLRPRDLLEYLLHPSRLLAHPMQVLLLCNSVVDR
jgi:hypothetical protein